MDIQKIMLNKMIMIIMMIIIIIIIALWQNSP